MNGITANINRLTKPRRYDRLLGYGPQRHRDLSKPESCGQSDRERRSDRLVAPVGEICPANRKPIQTPYSTASVGLGSSVFSRQPISFGAPAADAGNARKIANIAAIQFGPAANDWPEAIAFGIFDSQTDGNLLYWNTLAGAVLMPSQGPPKATATRSSHRLSPNPSTTPRLPQNHFGSFIARATTTSSTLPVRNIARALPHFMNRYPQCDNGST